MRKYLLILVLFLFVPIYVNAENNYLYDVLKNEVALNRYAREYTGEHHDSFTEEPSKKIYHWYSTTQTNDNLILNKNNVIFANHCWQIIRTTDTGGVKLIYNGEVVDDKCLNTRGNHVGYSQYTDLSYSTISLSNTYYYGTDYTYNKSNNTFSLSGEVTTGEIKLNTYTCRKTTAEGTCTRVELVAQELDNNKYYVIALGGSEKYSGIGTVKYNMSRNSIADIGYMYNKRYTSSNEELYSEIMYNSSMSLSTSYWYADNISWNTSTSKWELVNPYKVSSTSEYPSLLGKYTFNSTSDTSTNSRVKYIAYINNNTAYHIELKDGHEIDYYNKSYTFGETYTDNGDGTFTINSPTTFQTKDFYTMRDNIVNKYICINAVNNTCNELWYNGNTLLSTYIIINNNSNVYKFGEGFTYENGKYTLSGDIVSFFDFSPENIDKIKTHSYSCLSNNEECENINYIFSPTSASLHYYSLNNGKGMEDIINEMLFSEDVNQIESTAKKSIDAWYKKNLIGYEEFLEDTIYCNDRSINSYANYNSSGTTFVEFSKRTDLSCPKITDKFSTKNEKAKLIYPIGLGTYAEMNLLNNRLRNIGSYYRLITPAQSTYSEANNAHVTENGSLGSDQTNAPSILRPVVSLNPDIIIKSGDGSMNNPYTVDLIKKYTIDVEINNETEELTVEIEDLSQVKEGEIVNFKVTPIKGRKLTSIRIVDEENNEIDYTTTDNNNYIFTMPSSNVTIKPSYERVKNAVNVEDNKNTKEFIIEVNDATAVVYEDTVRFRLEPEEGYEVEDIDITDEQNNKISYKKTNNQNEYEFIMPDTNVLIKPKYRLIPKEDNSNNSNILNPDTKRQILLVLIPIIILVLITYKFKKKRLT